MKRKLAVVLLTLATTVLATGVLGWNYQERVFAADTGKSTKLLSSEVEYEQYEMPIISITTASQVEITSDIEYVDAKISIIDDEGNFEMTDMSTAIRLRGSSSAHADKKSYKFKFEKKQNLLNIGDGKGKPWLLIANHSDHSLLRNFIAYNLGDKLTGMAYSPNCRSVELFINGEYQGVYLLCEDKNVNKDRIAIEEAPDEVENNGYLVEMTRYDGENMFEVDTATYDVVSDLSENTSIKEQQMAYISGYINEAYNALKTGIKSEVDKYVDIDSLVDIYIGNEIVKNVDVGWDSFYMYKDVKGKLCFGPMWDFDLAMGNANCVKGFDAWAGFSPYNVLNVNANSNPWFCHALSLEWFRELVTDRWNELQDELNDIPNLVIREAESNYRSYCRNFDKWGILGKQTNISPDEIVALPTYKDHYLYLSNWLAKRIDWLTEQINGDDFAKGILVKEDGKVLSSDSNLIELSSILAFGQSDYKVLMDTTGITATFENSTLPWAQICATGFMLEGGAEYILSFDYKCNMEVPVSFAVQENHAPWSPFYSGKVDMSNEFKHFEVTFIPSKSDSNCALAFNLAGSTYNGATVTVDNMSLVKKSASTFGYGDINGDGSVDSLDYGLLRKYLLGKINSFEYEYGEKAADVNADSEIDSIDLVLIRMYLLGMISAFPAEG